MPGMAETPAVARAMKVRKLVSCILKDCLKFWEVVGSVVWLFCWLLCLMLADGDQSRRSCPFIDKIPSLSDSKTEIA